MCGSTAFVCIRSEAAKPSPSIASSIAFLLKRLLLQIYTTVRSRDDAWIVVPFTMERFPILALSWTSTAVDTRLLHSTGREALHIIHTFVGTQNQMYSM